VWEEASRLYPLLGAIPREHRLDMRFPSGALIEFRHLQYEKDLEAIKSKAWCYIALDEATQFPERMWWYLFSRNRSTCGVRPYFRGATNPDCDSHLRELIAWWIGCDGFPIPERSGVIRWLARVQEELVWADDRAELEQRLRGTKAKPSSFTFISAKLSDNPSMAEADPDYESKLELLPYVDRQRLKYGNWDVQASAGDFFKRDWFEIVDHAPIDNVLGRVRFWDKAASEKKKGQSENPHRAWTVGVLLSATVSGVFYVEHMVRFQARPRGVEDKLKETAELDGRSVAVGQWQDPGQAGVVDADNTIRLLAGWTVHAIVAREDKREYAKPVSAQAERGNVKLVRGHWNERYLHEHENFPLISLKDCVDAMSGAFLYLTGGRIPSIVDVTSSRLDQANPWE